MIKYFCDKCGCEVGQMSAYNVFSLSKNEKVILCGSCSRKLDKVLKEADRKFFEEKGE